MLKPARNGVRENEKEEVEEIKKKKGRKKTRVTILFFNSKMSDDIKGKKEVQICKRDFSVQLEL